MGDSIVAGVGDLLADPSGGRGLLGRPLAELGPHLDHGVPGDRAAWYAVGSGRRRATMATGGVTSVMLQLGVNDVTAGRSAAQLAADRGAIRALFPGVNVFDTTLTPTTSSADGWGTAAGQTIPRARPRSAPRSTRACAPRQARGRRG